MFDHPVFASGIHGLKDQQNGPAVLRVELVLKLCHLLDALVQELLGALFGTKMTSACGIRIFQAKVFAVMNSVRIRQLAGPTHASSVGNRAIGECTTGTMVEQPLPRIE